MASIHEKVHLPLPTQGIQADVDVFHVGPDSLLPTSYNWLFRNGKMVTRPGLTAIANDPSLAPPLGMISYYDQSNQFHVVHSTTERWWRFNPGTNVWDDISDPLLLWDASLAFPAVFRTFNSGGTVSLLGVNGIDTPRAWNSDPLSDFTLFGGNAPVAQCIAICADRILLGNLPLLDPSAVDVSAFQDFTTGWGVTQTAVLVNTPGFIVSMDELAANQTAIYKTSSIYLASGTTGLAPIRFDLHVANIAGPAGPRAVVPLTSGLHAIFTGDGELYTFDGINYAAHPASNQVRLLFEQNASDAAGARRQLHGFHDILHDELWYFYVAAGDELTGPRDAIVINLNNNSVWKANWNKAGFSFTTSFMGEFIQGALARRAFVGQDTGQFYFLEGDNDAGLGLDVRMETGLSDLGDPTRVKTVEEAEHYFSNPASIQTPAISLLTSESGKDATVSTEQPITLTATSPGHYVSGHRSATGERITSRFVGMSIHDGDLTAPLEYRGSSITVVPRGAR